MNTTRRKFLKISALLPLFLTIQEAGAQTNPSLRAEFKYQSAPKGDMSCASCLEFIPDNKDAGRCRVIPGDDEISPNSYCTKWNSM